MGNVNRVPLGLLSLLDTQTQGQTPSNLQETIQATLNLEDFWLSNKGVDQQFANRVLAAVGQQTTASDLTVPEGELWLVSSISADFINLDAQQIRGSCGYRISPTAEYTALATTGLAGASAAANQLSTAALWLNRRMFARSGTSFQARFDWAAAVVLGVDALVMVNFVRLKV